MVSIETPVETFSIGILADRYGVSTESLRNWERAGLIPPATRTPGGHRRYTEAHFRALNRLLVAPIAPLPVSLDVDSE